MSQTNFKKTFEQAIECFTEKGKTIKGVYDLLLRGGVVHEDHIYIEHWSDLDLSLIVFQINKTILLQHRWLYNEIKTIFPYKLSLTLVTYGDFLSPFHHHGIKPIYYNKILQNSVSLLRNKAPFKETVSLQEQQLDCLANISYLIHDLKNKWLILDLNSNKDLHEYLCHAVKRTKHTIRNSLFVIEGIIEEEINENMFQKIFPKENVNFLQRLKEYKLMFSECKSDNKQLEEEILYILTTLESIHETLISIFNKKYAEKELRILSTS